MLNEQKIDGHGFFLGIGNLRYTCKETTGILPFLFDTVSRSGEIGLERRIGRDIVEFLYSRIRFVLHIEMSRTFERVTTDDIAE